MRNKSHTLALAAVLFSAAAICTAAAANTPETLNKPETVNKPETANASELAKEKKAELSGVKLISKRNIFMRNKARAGEESTAAKQVEVRRFLTVSGIVEEDGKRSIFAEDNLTGEIKHLAEGESWGEVKVVKINVGEVTLAVASGEKTVSVGESVTTGTVMKDSPVGAAASGNGTTATEATANGANDAAKPASPSPSPTPAPASSAASILEKLKARRQGQQKTK